MTTTSHPIDKKSLYLVRQGIPSATPVKQVTPPVHHLAIIDCSGSMYSDLPKIREQLKKRLPKLLKESDTFSLIWFSGRGEFGVLLEAEPISTLKDLQEVNQAIDKYLKCVGLTGFKEPIEEADRLIPKLLKKGAKDAVVSLMFLSDGCDNQWDRASILKAVEKTGKLVASATFVEYGYYADRNLLSSMAEKAGGTLIFAEDFNKFSPEFERVVTKPMTGGKRVEIKLKGDPILGMCWALDHSNGDLLTFDATGGSASIPEGFREIAYLNPTSVGTEGTSVDMAARSGTRADALEPVLDNAYAALSVLAVRMKPEIVYPILKALGDISFIRQFSTCFGKQKYSDFMQDAQAAAFTASKRFSQGWDPTLVPADDAFTVLDLLRVLSDGEDNALLLDDPAFTYSRISRARVDANEELSADEKAQIDDLTKKMQKARGAAKIKEIQAQIDALLMAKQPSLKFIADPNPGGYAIGGLVYNEERPNISVLVKKTGTVDLSSKNPDPALPNPFPTHIYRNYAVVKDGLVNIDKLPVSVSNDTFKKLTAAGVIFTSSTTSGPKTTGVIDVKALPILNRKMVKAVSAKEFFELEWKLTKLRAAQKVYNAFKKEKFPKESKGFKQTYGDAAAEWLKEQGITDYSGFNPKQVQAESTDFYVSKELVVKLKGYSTLPSLKDARTKSNGPAALMKPVIEEVEEFFDKNPAKLHEKWLDGKQSAATAATRGLIFQKAETVFSILVGQTWFKEFSSIDENSMTIKCDKQDVVATAEMNSVEIKI